MKILISLSLDHSEIPDEIEKRNDPLLFIIPKEGDAGVPLCVHNAAAVVDVSADAIVITSPEQYREYEASMIERRRKVNSEPIPHGAGAGAHSGNGGVTVLGPNEGGNTDPENV